MSKARAKGTSWETELLAPLRRIFGPLVERAPLKGVGDLCDFVGASILVEAKNTQKPLFQQWVRVCRTKSLIAGRQWMLAWKGDRRTHDGKPLAVMDLEFALELLAAWHEEPTPVEAVAQCRGQLELVA